MSDYGRFTATVRTTKGKGVARQLRKKGLIPAVLYGRGGENLSLTLDPHLFNKATDPGRSYNTLYQIALEQDGAPTQTVPAMVVDIQRDAIRDDVMHVDFLRVDPEQEVHRKIPVRYHGRAAGVMKGGRLTTYRRIVHVAAKPGELPEELAIDLGPLDSGQTLRIKDMSLPGTTFLEPPEAPLAFVEMPKAKTKEEEAAAAAAAPKAKAKK